MVYFYNDVMALKASKDEIDRSREYLIMQGFKVEEPRHGLPSVREQAAGLRDITPDYSDNWFVKGTKPGDVSDRVEEALSERMVGLRFDKKKRYAYNRQLELMAQVAPSASDLRVNPLWRPRVVSFITTGLGVFAGYSIFEIEKVIDYIATNEVTDIQSLFYGISGAAIGVGIKSILDFEMVNITKRKVRRQVSNLVEALKETPQRIKLPQEGAQ